MTWHRGTFAIPALATAALIATPSPGHAAEDVLLEFHFKPVHNAQIAIWLADAQGNFVKDVFVTQATGTLGIGNRPGRWDFLSSWRFPYGPRPQVLPVWAHARGKRYPQLVFFDDDPADQESLGWHENSSSAEPYFCRPLSPSENQTISTDTMTCPSPTAFQSDKGRFSGSAMSVYPPRNDLVTFEDGGDSSDVPSFRGLNDLDAVTGATPFGEEPTIITTVIDEALLAQGSLTAYIEINLEHDENDRWAYDRETDHYVDPRLANYGVEYMGQPSVVYAVNFDPNTRAFTGTDAYRGYGQWDGASGELHPPDDTISTQGGSGSDRLRLYTKNDETFRFGVFNHGPGSAPDGTSSTGGDTGDASGGDSGDTGGGDWGSSCILGDLPAATDLELEALDFDTVRVHFTIPPSASSTNLRNVRFYYRTGEMPLSDDNAGSAIQSTPTPDQCSGPLEPGAQAWCDLDQLFGNFEYQIGMRYDDGCSNLSPLISDSITTPRQKFQTVEGVCFVATAAWGGAWTDRVRALRYFRDLYLRKTGVGFALVQFYYSVSPPLARAIARRPWAREIARAALSPLADLARGITGV